MPKVYEPEMIAGGGSSPFDDLMYRWMEARIGHEVDETLAQYDTNALDEARSCADALLNVPLYQGDNRLRMFRDALAHTVNERAANAVLIDRLSGYARDIAFEHVEDAASWATSGLSDAVSVMSALKMFEDGDPEIWESMPKYPNLSGEFADSPTPKMLIEMCLEMDGKLGADAEEDVTSDVTSALADAYEQAVQERWEDALVKQLTREIGTGAERLATLARCAQANIRTDNVRADRALELLIDEAETMQIPTNRSI